MVEEGGREAAVQINENFFAVSEKGRWKSEKAVMMERSLRNAMNATRLHTKSV